MIRIALTFPGQGSQAAGMADSLLDAPLAAKLFKAASAAGLDLETALKGDDEALRATEIAQPALFFVEAVLTSLLPRTGVELLGVAGHSVGEYAALVAAEVMEPRAALDLVIKRGRVMAGMREGTMAAVLGLDIAVVEEVCQQTAEAGHVVVVANINAPGQVVISGTNEGVAAASEALKERGAKRVVPLNVSGAFHSPLMADAARDFVADINTATLNDTKIPVVANVDGQQSTRAEDIRQRLRRQLGSPVRWTDCVARLAGLGVDVIIELGPGGVLTGLAKRIAPGIDAVSASTAAEVRALPDVLGVKTR